MLLPHWTDGCIGSMEGLFFEASGTTPYHFLSTAAMSKQSSNPVRELRYVDNNADVGVPHLQRLGVRYAMVRTARGQGRGGPPSRPDVRRDVGAVGHLPGRGRRHRRAARRRSRSWSSSRDDGKPGDQRERNLELGTSWFQQRESGRRCRPTTVPTSGSGSTVSPTCPAARVEPGEPGVAGRHRRCPTEPIEPVALPDVTVSNVEIGQESFASTSTRSACRCW